MCRSCTCHSFSVGSLSPSIMCQDHSSSLHSGLFIITLNASSLQSEQTARCAERYVWYKQRMVRTMYGTDNEWYGQRMVRTALCRAEGETPHELGPDGFIAK